MLNSQIKEIWARSYIQTYLERDIRQLESIRNLRAFEQFTGLCAAWHGQEFKAVEFARDCGVSQPTIKAWLGVLEASYLLILFQPFHRNYGKRLIKTPKIYFVDPAIVHFLQGNLQGNPLCIQ